MALNKKIELNNGITTNYHRIVSIQQFINQETIIELASYTSAEKREEEKEAYKKAKETGQFPRIDVFIETRYITKNYEPEENIESAYQYIKELDQFNNSKDC